MCCHVMWHSLKFALLNQREENVYIFRNYATSGVSGPHRPSWSWQTQKTLFSFEVDSWIFYFEYLSIPKYLLGIFSDNLKTVGWPKPNLAAIASINCLQVSALQGLSTHLPWMRVGIYACDVTYQILCVL